MPCRAQTTEAGIESGSKRFPAALPALTSRGFRSATVMRESVEIIRGALSGEAFRYVGKSYAADIPPLRPEAHVSREKLPLYFGATGPVLQRMAGEMQDFRLGQIAKNRSERCLPAR